MKATHKLFGVLFGLAIMAGLFAVATPAKAASVIDSGNGNLVYYLSYWKNTAPSSPDSPPAYMPNQYLVVSQDPYFTARLQVYVTNSEIQSVYPAGDIGRTRMRVYQVSNLSKNSGTLLGRTGPYGSSGYPMRYQSFSVPDSPPDQIINGGPGYGLFNDVDPTKVFNDPNFPQYNGYYVFLLKINDVEDTANGYVTGIQRLWTDPGLSSGQNPFNDVGCPITLNGPGEANCPPRVNHPNAPGYAGPGSGGVISAVQYNLSADDPDQIASAPSNISFATFLCNRALINLGICGTVTLNESQYLRFVAAGNTCRKDTQSNGLYLTNGDFDNPIVTSAHNNPNNYNVKINQANSGSAPAQAWNNNSPPGNWVYSTLSGGFFGGIRSIKLGRPFTPFNADSVSAANPGGTFQPDIPGAVAFDWTNQAGIGFLYFNNTGGLNYMYMGGAQFTQGALSGCSNASITQNSPQAWGSGYIYNGRDATSLVSTTLGVDSRLTFAATPSSGPNVFSQVTNQYVAFQYYLDGSPIYSSGNVGGNVNSWVNANAGVRRSGDVQIPSAGAHNWTACVRGGDSLAIQPPAFPGFSGAADAQNRSGFNSPAGWSCATTTFYVNQGPNAALGAGQSLNGQSVPANGGNVNYACDYLFTTFTDPDTGLNGKVSGQISVSWTTPSGQSGGATTVIDDPFHNPPTKPTGSTFNSDELWVNSGGYKTLTQYLRNDIPDGATVTWSARGRDYRGTSDAGDLYRFFSGALGDYVDPIDNTGFVSLASQPSTVWKSGTWSAPAAYYKNTRPNFATPPATKKLLDVSGNALPNNTATDGQTVQVRTALQNSGQTPMKYYQVIDYLGSIRDFRNVRNISLGIGSVANPNNIIRYAVSVTPVPVLPNTDQLAPENDQTNGVSATSTDRTSAWKLDFGSTTTGAISYVLNLTGRGSELAPGEWIVINYFTDANRNATVTDTGGTQPTQDQPGATNNTTGGDYNRRLQVGSPVSFSDAHIYTQFQENYCDNTNRVERSLTMLPGSVLAPYVRTGRGDVGSNSNIQGYLGGDNNATFAITAKGQLQNFNGANGPQITGYTTPDTQIGCTNEIQGGLDWRRTMIRNFNSITAAATQAIPAAWSQSGGTLDVDLAGKTWYAPSNLTINRPLRFTGVGTIAVRGNLTINGNLTYQADAGQINSLGVIVVPSAAGTGGNVAINAGVTQLVGSYFALDSLPQIDNTGCPVGIPATGSTSTSGVISTGGGNQQLKIDGLMIARYFNFQRYYTDPTDSTTDPAENVYYDGRVVAATPPGFSEFRNKTQWYEIAP